MADPKKPAEPPKPKGITQALKIAGGALLLCASIGIFYKRLPDRKFVEVHQDKPRPRAGAAQTPDAAPARPAARSAPSQSSKPAPGASAATPASTPASAPLAALPEAKPEAPVELSVACAAEVGVLCYGVAEDRLPGCLCGYDDVLLKDCRAALETRGAKLNDPAGRSAVAAQASAILAAAGAAARPAADWTGACTAEIGVLCYGVPERRLPACLGCYDNVLLKDCRSALQKREAQAAP